MKARLAWTPAASRAPWASSLRSSASPRRPPAAGRVARRRTGPGHPAREGRCRRQVPRRAEGRRSAGGHPGGRRRPFRPRRSGRSEPGQPSPGRNGTQHCNSRPQLQQRTHRSLRARSSPAGPRQRSRRVRQPRTRPRPTTPRGSRLRAADAERVGLAKGGCGGGAAGAGAGRVWLAPHAWWVRGPTATASGSTTPPGRGAGWRR